MKLIPLSKQEIWQLLHPKQAREVDRANALAAAREREESDRAKFTADLAHRSEEGEDTPR
jgi:hypothetical protein